MQKKYTNKEKIKLVKKIIGNQKGLSYPEFNLLGLAVFKKVDPQELANFLKISQVELKKQVNQVCLKIFNNKPKKNDTENKTQEEA